MSFEPCYESVKQMLELIDEPNRSCCQKILSDNLRLFKTVPGSSHNHQAWPGGYYDHVQEVMNIGAEQYSFWDRLRPFPFSLSDLLLALFLHDLEKPWKYELSTDGSLQYRPGMETKEAQQTFRMKKLAEYGIQLTREHINGIEYAEGEIKNHSNKHRFMGELAAWVHVCDIISARGWHNYPLPENDPWEGAKRSNA